MSIILAAVGVVVIAGGCWALGFAMGDRHAWERAIRLRQWERGIESLEGETREEEA